MVSESRLAAAGSRVKHSAGGTARLGTLKSSSKMSEREANLQEMEEKLREAEMKLAEAEEKAREVEEQMAENDKDIAELNRLDNDENDRQSLQDGNGEKFMICTRNLIC